MPLKNVQRITFSLPKATIIKLELKIPKNKRSRFVAELIESSLSKKNTVTLEEIHEFWTRLGQRYPDRTKKTALELQREDRRSH